GSAPLVPPPVPSEPRCAPVAPLGSGSAPSTASHYESHGRQRPPPPFPTRRSSHPTGTVSGNAGSALPEPSRATVSVSSGAVTFGSGKGVRPNQTEKPTLPVGIPPAGVPVTFAESCTSVPIGSDSPATPLPPVPSHP